MHQYTKQQLQGSIRFGSKCLIGNWSEEIELQKAQIQSLLMKKETGTLKLDQFQCRMEVALAGVELTKVRDDPYVHFGDVLQIIHCDRKVALSCDVEDQDPRPGERACACTASKEITHPVARNTFLIAKYTPPKASALEEYYDDDVLRYGQKIRIIANPMAQDHALDALGGPRPLCLFSKPVSTTHYAKYSRHQLVGFTLKHNFDSVWKVLTPNPKERVVSQGVEVMAGAPILLVHCATKSPLCLETQKYLNDFGQEIEVSAHGVTSLGAKHELEALFVGDPKAAIPRAETNVNHWTFVTGSTVASLPQPQATSAMEVNALLEAMNAELATRPCAAGDLETKLVRLDNTTKDGSSAIKLEEFLLILHQVGLNITRASLLKLQQHFPAPKANSVDAQAFLTALKAQG